MSAGSPGRCELVELLPTSYPARESPRIQGRMSFHTPTRCPFLLALALAAALGSCSVPGEGSTAGDAIPTPMASFAQLIPGAWKTTFASGDVAIDTWHWGPGRYSVRSGALEVYYWHPGREQVCVLSLHAEIPGIGRGAGEGTIRFDGSRAEGRLDLYQPAGLRKLGMRWVFDGPDRYRDTLLEDGGSGEMQTLAEWTRHRIERSAESAASDRDDAPQVSAHLRAFQGLVGGTWESSSGSSAGLRTRTTFSWLPEFVHARVQAPITDREATHVLDAYFYQQVRTGKLHCLALSSTGGVYEGEVVVLEGGALRSELQGHEAAGATSLEARLALQADGTLRQSVWRMEEGARRVVVDGVMERRR